MAWIADENVHRVIKDFDDIKSALEEMGVAVPYGTDTSEYGDFIRKKFSKAPFINTTSVTDWSYYNYYGARSETIKNLDTSNGRSFSRFCYFAQNLIDGGEIYAQKSEDFTYAWGECRSMTDLILHLNSTKSSTMKNAFFRVSQLVNLTIYGTIKVDSDDLNFAYCGTLTVESLMSIIDAIEDNTGEDKKYTVTFGSANLAKLTAEQKDTLTAKNINFA